jgi:hypothetical protein
MLWAELSNEDKNNVGENMDEGYDLNSVLRCSRKMVLRLVDSAQSADGAPIAAVATGVNGKEFITTVLVDVVGTITYTTTEAKTFEPGVVPHLRSGGSLQGLSWGIKPPITQAKWRPPVTSGRSRLSWGIKPPITQAKWRPLWLLQGGCIHSGSGLTPTTVDTTIIKSPDDEEQSLSEDGEADVIVGNDVGMSTPVFSTYTTAMKPFTTLLCTKVARGRLKLSRGEFKNNSVSVEGEGGVGVEGVGDVGAEGKVTPPPRALPLRAAPLRAA